MGGYNEVTLDRDRAFDVNSLNELLTQGKSILNAAISISQKMETSISAISGVYSGINGDYKVEALGSDVTDLSGTLEKDIYQDTIDRMKKIITRLISDMPTYDNSLAQSMSSIQEVLGSVNGRISEMRGLLDTGDVNLSYEDFTQRLKDLKTGWDETTEDLAELLAEIENDMLGVSVTAVQYSSDPVNLSTGNFVYDHEDMRINGEIPLSFHRYYNSKDRIKGSMGRCFVHNYESHLEENVEKGKITISMGDGQKKTFQKMEDGTYRSLYSAMETLTKEGDSHILTKLAGERIIYNEAGQMIRRENGYGRGITFSYHETGKIEKAETDNHTFLTYNYNEAGQLVQVADHTGRTIKLSYERGKLSTVETPQGSRYVYHYGKNGRIAESINPRGYVSVKNTYDEKRRITRQEFPDGGHMEYAYDDKKRQVILTERNGSKITYVHDSKYRNTDILYEDGTKEHFEYNGKNQRILYVDRNGNVTKYAYDNRGNLTQIINALGIKISITYDVCNKPITIKINGKEKQKNIYDGKGNLLKTIDALSRKNLFAYNGSGLPETVIQPDGSTIHMEYDERGNITGMTDAGGGKTRYEYDDLNRVIRITDPNGNQMRLTYDRADNIHTLTNAAGDVRTFEYNESNKVTGITDFDGSTIRRTYNVLNKPEELTDQMGRTTKFLYDSMWNLTRITMPDGAETHYHYDDNNRLTCIEDALGNMVSCTYDGEGNCISQKDQLGHTIRFTYDALGQLVRAVGEEGAEMSYVYDGEGHVTEVQDALGNKVCMEYDEAGQLIKESNTMGNSRIYVYTPLGKVKSVTDEAGLTTAYSYLPGGQLLEVTYSDGTKESYTYDANGNIKTHTNRNGFVSAYDYDTLDRIIRISGSGGEKKEYTYDAVGNVTSMTDVYGHVTRYEYSLTGRLIKVTDALGNETEYTYDLCDRLIEINQYGEKIDGATTGLDEDFLHAEKQNRDNRICHVTHYQRNKLGQVETITDALGQKEHYTYDAKGQLIAKLDKEGYLTKYGYTAQGDVNHIAYADGREVKLSYNPLRQLEEMEDWLGITKIENDAMGRAVRVQCPDGREVSYTYGKSGERTGIVYPDGRKVSYTYDSQLRLSGLKDGNDTIAYTYDGIGRLVQKTFPNGMETSYTYNAEGHLTELTHRDREGILDRYAYQYDLMGNKTAIEKQRRGLDGENGFYAYGYDALGRLCTVTRNGENLRTYEYDAFGNRSLLKEGNTETTYTYNAMNQLISKTDVMKEETYAYDKRGNLSFIMENGDLKKQYIYGASNRLEQAVNGNGDAAFYTYNGLGHRVGKTTGTMETVGKDYGELQGADALDPLSRLKEQTIQPETRIQYTIDLTRNYHNLLQKEEKGSTQIYLWDGNVVGMKEENGSRQNESGKVQMPLYYIQDELGSPIRLQDEQGRLTETYGYDEFGQDLYGNQGIVQPFGYTGYQTDQIAGTYYAQAREYRADLGRFAGEDVIKGNLNTTFSLNSYVYCWNNPMIYNDLNGMWINVVVGAAVGAVFGLGAQLIGDVISGEKPSLKKCVSATVGGAVGGAVVGATGNLGAAGAASSATSTLIEGVWDMADGTTEFNAENVKKLAAKTCIDATIGYGVGKITGKFTIKWGDKLIKKIPKLSGWQFKYNYADEKIRRGVWTILDSLKINGSKFFAVETISSLPGLGVDTSIVAINNWITRIIDSAATQDIITDIKEKMVDFIEKLGDSIEELFVPDQPCELQGGA